MRGSHLGGNGLGSDQWTSESLEDVFVDDVKEAKPYVPRSELETHLRSATPVRYDFIQSDETCLKHNGQCVLDQIVKIYRHMRLGLARERFVEACYEYERGLAIDTAWGISQGVRVATLSSILRDHDVSAHSFDILGKRLGKHISRSRGYPPSCATP